VKVKCVTCRGLGAVGGTVLDAAGSTNPHYCEDCGGMGFVLNAPTDVYAVKAAIYHVLLRGGDVSVSQVDTLHIARASIGDRFAVANGETVEQAIMAATGAVLV
jgi:hypothetical protein